MPTRILVEQCTLPPIKYPNTFVIMPLDGYGNEIRSAWASGAQNTLYASLTIIPESSIHYKTRAGVFQQKASKTLYCNASAHTAFHILRWKPKLFHLRNAFMLWLFGRPLGAQTYAKLQNECASIYIQGAPTAAAALKKSLIQQTCRIAKAMQFINKALVWVGFWLGF